jgi:hypothetical protein
MHGASKRLILILALLCFGLAVLSVAIPQRINYQGVLKNKSTGQILPDGNYGVTFRLYTASTGGSAVWSETTTVTISNGILNYQLGSKVAIALAFDANYYLGVQVSGDSEMSPRERLTSVGYAYRAANADNADNATNATYATNIGGLGIADLDSRYLNASGGDTWQGALVGSDTLASPLLSVRNYGSGNALYAYTSSFSNTLEVKNDYYGNGIYVNSIGPGIYATSSTSNAIWAQNSTGSSVIFGSQYGDWRAITGYKYSNSDYPTVAGFNFGSQGQGVYGYTTSTTYGVFGENAGTGNYGIGVYGKSNAFATNGAGVKGTGYFGVRGDGSFIGVYGLSGYYGLYGVATSWPGYGVYADSAYIGIRGRGDSYGIYGTSDDGYALYGSGSCGLYAYSNKTNGYGVYANNNSRGYGLYAYSSAYRGGWIGTGTPSAWYALYVNSGGLYVAGDIYASGSKAGYVVDLCKNNGAETLESGDIVVIEGSTVPVLGEIPVMLIGKTTTAYNTAVVGIIDRGITISNNAKTGEASAGLDSEAPDKEMVIKASESAGIDPNQYVSVVTLGAYKAIKVDASFGAIHPGDLLTTSATAGYAMKAQPVIIEGKPFYPNGCIIGKALGTLESGQGTIPVSVDRQ